MAEIARADGAAESVLSSEPRALIVTEQIAPGGKRSHVEALRAGFAALGSGSELLDWRGIPAVRRAWVGGGARLLARLERGWGQRWLVPQLERAFTDPIRRRLSADSRLGLVHAQEPATLLGARRAAPDMPLVLTVHGPAHREVASAYHLPAGHPTIAVLRRAEADAFRTADAVISVDRAHADYVRELGGDRDIVVIPNFVDTTVFHPAVAPASFPAALEGWIAGRPLLLCARRLVPKNGVRHAIETAAILASRGTDAALVVVGDGPERAELEAVVDRLSARGVVHLYGAAPTGRMPGWLRRGAVVLVPSVPSHDVREATSISVLEAQACGRPVVASALGGIMEIVTHERTGLLCAPGDPEASAAAVRRLLDDPELAGTLGEQARGAVMEHHSHVVGARRYLEVYRGLISRYSAATRAASTAGS
jgi:glycosyltransferase involved in cell wall biosynthesis